MSGRITPILPPPSSSSWQTPLSSRRQNSTAEKVARNVLPIEKLGIPQRFPSVLEMQCLERRMLESPTVEQISSGPDAVKCTKFNLVMRFLPFIPPQSFLPRDVSQTKQFEHTVAQICMQTTSKSGTWYWYDPVSYWTAYRGGREHVEAFSILPIHYTPNLLDSLARTSFKTSIWPNGTKVNYKEVAVQALAYHEVVENSSVIDSKSVLARYDSNPDIPPVDPESRQRVSRVDKHYRWCLRYIDVRS